MYKISIIIPVFNVEDYIDNAFQSIYNQTFNFEDIEIIFIDDNSTDNSLEIIEKYAKKYRNVISIHLDTNSGTAGKPRNIGMSHATADYIMFLDPDDLFTDDACEILYDEILNNWAYITVVAQIQQQNIVEYVAYNGIMKIRPAPGSNGDGSNNTVLFGVIGGVLGVIVIGLVVVILFPLLVAFKVIIIPTLIHLRHRLCIYRRQTGTIGKSQFTFGQTK